MLFAQDGTHDALPQPSPLETPGATAAAASRVSAPAPISAPTAPGEVAPATLSLAIPTSMQASPFLEAAGYPAGLFWAPLLLLGGLGGLLLYQSGLTRAKNCAHTSVLLLFGVVFGLAGYWMGGFAVELGGVGNLHAALAQPVAPPERAALDEELGFSFGGHRWGLMGSSGFFLATDETTRGALAAPFFGQAVLVTFAIAAALSAGLERARLLAMAIFAFVIGAVIYPLMANWVWGGGWLAQLGPEMGLGHGVIDLGGAGMVHETAGTLALVIALVLGPRHGRFTRNRATGVPGHNVPFTILGTLILLIAWLAENAAAYAGVNTVPGATAAVNLLLGAIGAVLAAIFAGAGRRQRATPLRLTRALLGGTVSLCGGGALFDPWAAFFIGACAGLLVEAADAVLEKRAIDDTVNAIAIFGAGGAWGLVAIGLFANGSAGQGLNGVAEPIRGLFFGGAWHQLAAQIIGCAVNFGVVFVLGYGCLSIIQKIVGDRVRMADEIQGLDWTQAGALGYQPDVESEFSDDTR